MNRKRSVVRLVAGLCVVALTCGVGRAGASTGHGADPLEAKVRRAAEAFMSKNDIPGMAVAVLVDGKPHFYEFGVASKATRQKVDADTLFELGSISKTFTATLAAYAQAKGRLDLDSPVATLLPELDGTAFGKVPLLNLATHTAGGFPLQVPESVHDDVALLAYLKDWSPRYPVGTKRTYANPSIGMLGRAAARSLGMPFREVMEKQLLPGLGLSSTYLTVPADKLPRYAQGYDKAGQPVRLNAGVLAEEAYGLRSSARDLAGFLQVQMGLADVDPLLKRAVRATHVGYFELGPMTQDLVWEHYRWPTSQTALLEGNAPDVVFKDQVVRALVPPRAPQNDVLVNKTGGTGGFGAYLAFVPARRLGLVILTNHAHATEERLRFAHAVLDVVAEAPSAPPSTTVPST